MGSHTWTYRVIRLYGVWMYCCAWMHFGLCRPTPLASLLPCHVFEAPWGCIYNNAWYPATVVPLVAVLRSCTLCSAQCTEVHMHELFQAYCLPNNKRSCVCKTKYIVCMPRGKGDLTGVKAVWVQSTTGTMWLPAMAILWLPVTAILWPAP